MGRKGVVTWIIQRCVLKNVTKVFGKHPQRALSLLKEGKSKSEILKETGMNVGGEKSNV